MNMTVMNKVTLFDSDDKEASIDLVYNISLQPLCY